jgi:RNA polymerase sigma-70 factor (ECF subfamily)
MEEVLSIKNGDVRAFECAYHRWSSKIYFFIFKQCGSEDIAEEVVQQVFVRLWEKRLNLSSDYTLSTQLFRMSTTIFIDELRKAAQSRKYLESMRQKQEVLTENTLEHKETLQLVYGAIDRMPPMRKQVFMMSRMEHLSYAQIAEKLSISPKTVENHIILALRYLRGLVPLLILMQRL